MTAARDTVVTTKKDRRVSIWVSDASGANVKEVAPAVQSSGPIDNVTWAANRLLFTNTTAGHRTVLSVDQDGGTAQEVATRAMWPATTSDGRTMVFVSNDPVRRGLWKIQDGGRPVQVFDGETGWPNVTRDDRSVVFTSPNRDTQSLWRISLDGGTPTLLANRFAGSPMLSPDGKEVAFRSIDDKGLPGLAICNLPDCSSLRFLPRQPAGGGARLQWTPDGTGFLYVAGRPENLWIESLDGKPPRQITHFTDDRQIADAA